MSLDNPRLQTKPEEFIDGSQANDLGIFEVKTLPYGPDKWAVGVAMFAGQEVTFIINGEPVYCVSISHGKVSGRAV